MGESPMTYAYLARNVHRWEEDLPRRHPFLLLPEASAAPKKSSVRRGTGQSFSPSQPPACLHV
jgi:hypothetical protein